MRRVFNKQLEALRSRVAALRQRMDESSISQQEQAVLERRATAGEFALVTEAFEELQSALAEMTGAEVALYQHNLELATALRLVEAERQRMKKELQMSEERLQLALEFAQMSSWDWNLVSNQVTWSDNYELLFGFTPGSFEGTYEAILSCIHPEDRQLLASAVARSLEEGVGYDHEFRIVCPDGSIRWLAAKGQVFYDEAGKAVRMMGINMDITQRKQAAEQIKVSLQETAQLQRLNQLKDEFLSTVSHELRTPMSNMKMAISMLKNSPTAERSQRYLEILQNECTREIDLINDLLDFQRLETASYPNLLVEAINLQDWLPTIIEPFRVRTQQRQQTLRLLLPNNFPKVILDRANLERILAELLNNACKYTPSGGEIVLSVEYAPRTSTIFTISNQTEISAVELPRIFDKFYRVPSTDPWKQGGTGLGLALVQKLVKQVQGTIEVESSRGWTTFTVQLPNQPSSEYLNSRTLLSSCCCIKTD